MYKRLALSVVISTLLAFWLITSVILSSSPRTSAASSSILISAVYYDTYLPNQPEESFRLTNVANAPIDLSNWQVTDGEGTITLTGSLTVGQSLWIAKTAISFTLEFGYSPTYEYGSDSDPSVPDLLRHLCPPSAEHWPAAGQYLCGQ